MLTSVDKCAAAGLLLLSGSNAPQAGDELQLRTGASRRVNAVYHVACLGHSIGCTRQTFEQFWHGHIGWTSADQTALDEWRETLADVTNRAPLRSGAPLLPNSPRFHPAQAARGLVFVAAVESRSASELQQRSRGVLSAPAAARLYAAIDHFERRFDPWWRSEQQRRRTVEERLDGVAERARKTGMLQVMSEVATFLEAKLSDPVLHLHAIIAPAPSSKDYAATQSGSHFFVEAVDAVTTEAFVHGAVHELTHYLYDSAPSDSHIALVREFAQSQATSFSGLYTYLNEAIAVAAQGLYADRVAAREGAEAESYTHPYVQPLGTAATPLLREAIATRKTLFSDFTPRYIAAGSAALGNKLVEPRFVLSQVALLLPDDADRLTTAYDTTMLPQASARFRNPAEVDAFPDLNVVRFVRYAALEALADQIPDLVSLRARKGFAFAMKRGARAHTYVLAGRDTDSIIEVISRLGTMETLSGSGLLFSLD